ncbi:VOC family protein [Bacillus sp. NEB1478]|uniref:VOC family protein n=1 Tax=Bacillus sp. NEB1478 TaxID=3073816 RepID=UPI0028735711|nr:VOC family protein [Bacillus sp. NEB1478]WNB91003.1 VOC family protein [Bacillus sp. NEB1478]
MIYEMTYQVRVSDFSEGLKWYKTLLNKEPDFTPHDGFAEWELLPGCWLQVAEGIPTEESGPLRFGVLSIEDERNRMISEMKVEPFEIHVREEVPVRWATFADPWGNRLGFFEYKNEAEKKDRMNKIQTVSIKT